MASDPPHVEVAIKPELELIIKQGLPVEPRPTKATVPLTVKFVFAVVVALRFTTAYLPSIFTVGAANAKMIPKPRESPTIAIQYKSFFIILLYHNFWR